MQERLIEKGIYCFYFNLKKSTLSFREAKTNGDGRQEGSSKHFGSVSNFEGQIFVTS